MNILGLHTAFQTHVHDPSACLISDGELIAAYEEERLNRIKTSPGLFPEKAMAACLEIGGLTIDDIDYIAIDGKTAEHLEFKVRRYIEYLYDSCPPIEKVFHQKAHGSGAFLASGFSDALVFSIDGCGDNSSVYIYEDSLTPGTEKVHYLAKWPVSIGAFYTAFANYFGFPSIEGEYKMMGMAAFGTDRFDLSSLIEFDPEKEEIRFDESMWDERHHTSMFEPHFIESVIYEITKVAPLPPGKNRKFEQEHFDLAASVQAQFTKVYLGVIKHFLKKTGKKHLCLSGGCTLNCLANKDLIGDESVQIYVQPGASDRGLSIGSGYEVARRMGDTPVGAKSMYLGKRYGEEDIYKAVKGSGLPFEKVDSVFEEAAKSLAEGKVLGWFRGRSEFGPRALGHRSILGATSVEGMKDKINAKIKFREKFRPFAPSMLMEDFTKITGLKNEYPYMTFSFDIPDQYKEDLREAIQVDGTARIQTVSGDQCPDYAELLRTVKKHQSIGAVLNTSFNLAGEPIVETPTDAIRTFVSSGLDELFIEDYRLSKVQT